jgi:multiple sugar transport system ATP-binding protein
VKLVQPTGSDTFMLMQLNGTEVTCRVNPAQARNPGEEMEFAFDMSKVVFFDPVTEARIA